MKITSLKIGEPFTLKSNEQIAGAIAYMLTKEGFDVDISTSTDSAILLYARKRFLVYRLAIERNCKMTLPEIDGLIEKIKAGD